MKAAAGKGSTGIGCRLPATDALPFLLVLERIKGLNERMNRGAPGHAWHLPGGPVGPASRWAATSNVEVGQTNYTPLTGGVGRERGTKSQRGGKGRREWNGEWAHEPLAKEGWLYLDICVGVPEFQVTPLLMGPFCQRFVLRQRVTFCVKKLFCTKLYSS